MKNFEPHILDCIENNKLTERLYTMLENSGYDEESLVSIQESFDFFLNKNINIISITSGIHEMLCQTSNFIKHKDLLKNSNEEVGLLLLPKIIFPDFTNVPDFVDACHESYPINALLYSWLETDNHDKISGSYDAEDQWHRKDDRTLLIIPICDDRITQATTKYEMLGYNEEFGWEYKNSDGRAWYGKIHDYVMSSIIYFKFLEKTGLGF